MQKLLLFILATVMLLTSCGGVGDLSEPVINEHNHSDAEDYRQFDSDLEYDENAITIAIRGGIDFPDIIKQYMRTVANVNIIEYTIDYEDKDDILIKLMAEDTDIDIYVTNAMDIYTFVEKGYYVDLAQYDSLKQRFDEMPFAKAAATVSGEYIGAPTMSFYYDSSTGTSGDTADKYLINNLDCVNGEYLDEDGEELYEVFRHLYDHPDDPKDSQLYSEEFCSIGTEYMFISPYSTKKEQAVDFLKYYLDVMAGKIEPEGYTITRAFPTGDNYDEAVLFWNHDCWSIVEPIRKAIYDIRYNSDSVDGSDEALRKLAQEAARQVEMRLEG